MAFTKEVKVRKLLQWLFGKRYRFAADFYDPGPGAGPEWRKFSGLFLWGGVFNSPKEGRVLAGPYEVYLEPIRTANGIRWNFKQIFKRGSEEPDFYVDDISVTKEEPDVSEM